MEPSFQQSALKLHLQRDFPEKAELGNEISLETLQPGNQAKAESSLQSVEVADSQRELQCDVEEKRKKEFENTCLQMSNFEKTIESLPESITIRVTPSKLIFDFLEEYITEIKNKGKTGRKKRKFGGSRRGGQKLKLLNQKNFSKKLGDQFCEYLLKEHKLQCHAKFKDKLSWKLLNKYFGGQKTISKKLPSATFQQLFMDFVRGYDIESLNDSKTNEISKIYYKVCAVSLKVAFHEFEMNKHDLTFDGCLSLHKVYPETILMYSSV